MSLYYIGKYETILIPKYLSLNTSLTPEMIEYIGVDKKWNWNYISQYCKLSLDFVKKFRKRLSLGYISRNENLTIEIIEWVGVDHKKWKWKSISKHFKLTLDFVKKFYNRLMGKELSENKHMNKEILDYLIIERKNKKRLDLYNRVAKNCIITLDLLKNYTSFNYFLLQNKSLTPETLEYIKKQYNMDSNYVNDDIQLSLVYVKKYKDKLNPYGIVKNKSLTFEIVKEIGLHKEMDFNSNYSPKVFSNIKLDKDVIDFSFGKEKETFNSSIFYNKTLTFELIEDILLFDLDWDDYEIISENINLLYIPKVERIKHVSKFCDIELRFKT